MDSVIQIAIVFTILTALYLIVMSVPFFEPFKRIIQIVCGAIAVILLLKFLADFV